MPCRSAHFGGRMRTDGVTRDASVLRRALIATTTALLMVPAVGMVLQMPWATAAWPFPTGRLTFIFLGAMIAAIVATATYVVWIRDWGAVAGGALNLFVMFGGFAWFLWYGPVVGDDPQFPARPSDAGGHFLFAAACPLIALGAVGLLAWARGKPFADPRPVPRLVSRSFVLFIVVLVGAGATLVLRRPNIMPWPLDRNTSVMVGTIFLADATYFAYGLFKPAWSNARGQLLAFLVYDLVLIVPLLRHFEAVKPESLVNLVLYTAVVVYSGALAAYYLVRSPRQPPA